MKPLLRRALGAMERSTCFLLALGFALAIHVFARLNRYLED